MALSNWDTLAFDNEGKSCLGNFINKITKSVLEIYKNWVYIHNEKMWIEKSSYTKPVIAQINDGNIQLAGFDIKSKRGMQNGIYVYAEYRQYFKKAQTIIYRFAGIGCAGYVDKVEQVLTKLGRIKEYSDNNDLWCSGSGTKFDEDHDKVVLDSKKQPITEHFIENLTTRERIVHWDESKQGPYDYGNDWIGVTKETVTDFFKWLCDLADATSEFPEKEMVVWIKKCMKSKAIRYNQGNLFFTNNAGIPLQATEVGKSKEPVMMQMIKKKGVKKNAKKPKHNTTK